MFTAPSPGVHAARGDFAQADRRRRLLASGGHHRLRGDGSSARLRQEVLKSEGEMTMSSEQQQAMDSLYAIDNVLTIKITMPPGDWDAVRNEPPKGGVCNFEWKGGARY